MERDLVFVTVGTDHHPFDRLCAWADAWVSAARHPEIPWFLQSGTSKAPATAPYRDYIGYDDMCSYMSRAIADPSAFAVSQDGAEIAAAVAKFEELVDGLFQRKRSRR